VQVEVLALWPEGRILTGAKLRAPPALRSPLPGQYVSIADKQGRPLSLALASPPGAPELELLLGKEAVDRLDLAAGQTVELEGPLGPGFPLAPAEGGDVLVFATGSALSAVRSVLDVIAVDRARFGQVRAYFGALSDDAHAYLHHDQRWKSAGIEVRRTGARPWVQELFLAEADAIPRPERTYAFAAGLPVLIEGVKNALLARGVPAERLGLNFGW
jgi:NAD(P)H-flavin reductase